MMLAKVLAANFLSGHLKAREPRLLQYLGLKHIDRQPMGDIAGVVVLLVASNPNIEFTYSHYKGENQYIFNSREVKETLEDIPINSPQIIKTLKEMIRQNLEEL